MAKILNRNVLTIKHLNSYLMSIYANVVLDLINYRAKLIKRVYIK